MLKNVLTAKEVAEYLEVHVTMIYRLLKNKQIPAFRLGSDWRFNIESIDEWRRAREREVGENSDGGAGLVLGERSGSGARK